MKVNVSYCLGKNFGDLLNKDILCKMGIDLCFSEVRYANILGIGSILGKLIDGDKFVDVRQKLYVFSTGFNDNDMFSYKINMNPNICFMALRGRKTFEQLRNNVNGFPNNDIALADGGLLSNILIMKERNNIEIKYSVGIVAHAYEKKDLRIEVLRKMIPNSVVLNIAKKPCEFLHDLCECETIISTALHPLIASDSLGIPNRWIRLDDSVTATTLFKFQDYYSAFDLEIEPIYFEEIDNNIYGRILKEYCINYEDVQLKQEQLMHTIDKIKTEFIKDEARIKKFVVINRLYNTFIYYPRNYFLIFLKGFIRRVLKILKKFTK